VAHAAKIDSNGVVREVLVVDDDKFIDGKGNLLGQKVGSYPEDELLMEYMTSIGLGVEYPEEWRFTSYNNNFRGVYAGQGFTYDRKADQFIPPEPPVTQEIQIEEE
tara:strand:- start:212 stop:529 length:318 start_codon:yes stop_codon:yes gene_type:complete